MHMLIWYFEFSALPAEQFIFLMHERNLAVVGASGAVYGVLAAFAFLFPNTRLMLLFPPIPVSYNFV